MLRDANAATERASDIDTSNPAALATSRAEISTSTPGSAAPDTHSRRTPARPFRSFTTKRPGLECAAHVYVVIRRLRP